MNVCCGCDCVRRHRRFSSRCPCRRTREQLGERGGLTTREREREREKERETKYIRERNSEQKGGKGDNREKESHESQEASISISTYSKMGYHACRSSVKPMYGNKPAEGAKRETALLGCTRAVEKEQSKKRESGGRGRGG